MHTLIVDDEELARLRLRRLLDDIPECEVVGEATSGEEALELIASLDPELIFLDVRMPGMDGIAVAKALADYSEPPAVIFCTAYDEYALEAFDTLAQGYIVKPVHNEQLTQALRRAKKTTRLQTLTDPPQQPFTDDARQHIAAKSHRGIDLIPIDDILCFVADQKYVTVKYIGGEVLIDETLKELEVEFADRFARVHRNALVAINKISSLERDSSGYASLCLNGSDFRPAVSRRHLPLLRERLRQL